MIAWLQGTILEKEPPKVILNVNGVGYDIDTSMHTFFNVPAIGQQVALYVHTVVREDAFLLYGFGDKLERSLFKQLIKVNGVGPKSALSILSTLSPQLLIECIHNQDVTILVKVPGVGKKTAERLMIELQGIEKLMTNSVVGEVVAADSTPKAKQEAISALLALGYKQAEASKAVKKLAETLSCEEMIRLALKSL